MLTLQMHACVIIQLLYTTILLCSVPRYNTYSRLLDIPLNNTPKSMLKWCKDQPIMLKNHALCKPANPSLTL